MKFQSFSKVKVRPRGRRTFFYDFISSFIFIFEHFILSGPRWIRSLSLEHWMFSGNTPWIGLQSITGHHTSIHTSRQFSVTNPSTIVFLDSGRNPENQEETYEGNIRNSVHAITGAQDRTLELWSSSTTVLIGWNLIKSNHIMFIGLNSYQEFSSGFRVFIRSGFNR